MDLTSTEIREINDYCWKENISEKSKQGIVAFAQGKGFYAFKYVRGMVESDHGPEATGYKWGRYIPKYMRLENRKKRKFQDARAHDDMIRGYEESKERYDIMDSTTLASLLGDLLDKGDISQAQYDVGMRFLDGDTSQHQGNLASELTAMAAGEGSICGCERNQGH